MAAFLDEFRLFEPGALPSPRPASDDGLPDYWPLDPRANTQQQNNSAAHATTSANPMSDLEEGEIRDGPVAGTFSAVAPAAVTAPSVARTARAARQTQKPKPKLFMTPKKRRINSQSVHTQSSKAGELYSQKNAGSEVPESSTVVPSATVAPLELIATRNAPTKPAKNIRKELIAQQQPQSVPPFTQTTTSHSSSLGAAAAASVDAFSPPHIRSRSPSTAAQSIPSPPAQGTSDQASTASEKEATGDSIASRRPKRAAAMAVQFETGAPKSSAKAAPAKEASVKKKEHEQAQSRAAKRKVDQVIENEEGEREVEVDSARDLTPPPFDKKLERALGKDSESVALGWIKVADETGSLDLKPGVVVKLRYDGEEWIGTVMGNRALIADRVQVTDDDGAELIDEQGEPVWDYSQHYTQIAFAYTKENLKELEVTDPDAWRVKDEVESMDPGERVITDHSQHFPIDCFIKQKTHLFIYDDSVSTSDAREGASASARQPLTLVQPDSTSSKPIRCPLFLFLDPRAAADGSDGEFSGAAYARATFNFGAGDLSGFSPAQLTRSQKRRKINTIARQKERHQFPNLEWAKTGFKRITPYNPKEIEILVRRLGFWIPIKELIAERLVADGANVAYSPVAPDDAQLTADNVAPEFSEMIEMAGTLRIRGGIFGLSGNEGMVLEARAVLSELSRETSKAQRKELRKRTKHALSEWNRWTGIVDRRRMTARNDEMEDEFVPDGEGNVWVGRDGKALLSREENATLAHWAEHGFAVAL